MPTSIVLQINADTVQMLTYEKTSTQCAYHPQTDIVFDLLNIVLQCRTAYKLKADCILPNFHLPTVTCLQLHDLYPNTQMPTFFNVLPK